MSLNISNKLSELVSHEVGRHFLSLATCTQIRNVAQWLVSKDTWQLAGALKILSPVLNPKADTGYFAEQHIEHLLWCEHRKALWRSERIMSKSQVGIKLYIKGKKHLRCTSDSPTILISPMVVPYEDILWIITSVLGKRKLVVYGEGLRQDGIFSKVDSVYDLSTIRLANSSMSGTREILDILNQNGIFITYPDFVYEGHKAKAINFLGMKWPFSSSFISLCARSNTMLLPCHIQRHNNSLTVQFEKPVKVTSIVKGKDNSQWSHQYAGEIVARLLEQMILYKPEQWALLATILGHSHQRAKI